MNSEIFHAPAEVQVQSKSLKVTESLSATDMSFGAHIDFKHNYTSVLLWNIFEGQRLMNGDSAKL
jgi:hypothetical protein